MAKKSNIFEENEANEKKMFTELDVSTLTGKKTFEELNELLNQNRDEDNTYVSLNHLMGKSMVRRKTKETEITVRFSANGRGVSNVDTGIGFFDHMLSSFARHGFFDLTVMADGDLDVDSHHTIEDTGLVLGEAIQKALGDKAGIRRYGSCILPMDDALVMCAVDLSGRPYLGYDLEFKNEKLGDMDTEMVREFFYAVSYSAGMNIHLKQMSGYNSHHVCEAAFKAFAKALDQALELDDRIGDILSTKGSL